MRISVTAEDIIWHWLIALAVCGLVLTALGCGGSADYGCKRSAYELDRMHYRCTSAGELQTLDCGEWVTLDVCDSDCSHGPDPGCL